MKPLAIGVMSADKIRQRTLSIAKGEYKQDDNEPKIWFSSLESLSELLSQRNLELLKMIYDLEPETIISLSEISGLAPESLIDKLEKMSLCGILQLEGQGNFSKPIVKTTQFQILVS